MVIICCSFITKAQGHLHGQGQLFVSQENNDWHVQFILPAADVIGFEHAPENEEQEKTVQTLAKRLTQNDAVVKLSGKCTLSEATHSLLAEHNEDHEPATGHEGEREDGEHEGEHHEADDHDHDHENHEGHAKHADVEVEYHFSCSSKSEKLSVTLFQWLPTLSRIQAQWITDAGQGSATLTSTNPDVKW
jgi:hypothetical protein